MSAQSSKSSDSDWFIVDNSDEHWKFRNYFADWCDLSKSIDIATDYSETGAFLTLEDKRQAVQDAKKLLKNHKTSREVP